MAHPIPFQVLWNTVFSEPSEPETSERVETHRLTLVEYAKYISLLQRESFFGREEIPADAGDIRPKHPGQDFGNINDSDSIRRFWRFFLTTPNTPVHEENSAIWPEISCAQTKSLSDAQPCSRQQRKQDRVLALDGFRQD
jgi:hypothetical protein